jgi:transposase
MGSLQKVSLHLNAQEASCVSIITMTKRSNDAKPIAPAAPLPAITSALRLDLESVRAFILDMFKRGSVATLIATILALLTRMQNINTELLRKNASASRAKPPNEALRRLQLELPLVFAANDETPASPDKNPDNPDEKPDEKKKREKRVSTNPHAHSRPKLPAHLLRVPEVHLVEGKARTCSECDVDARHVGFKITEKLDIEPARFIVRQIKRETVACGKCHSYIFTAPKDDEVQGRGILGNELLVQALCDHYDDAVPWERMERNARAQDVPLAANTLASSVGCLIDLFDPIVEHIRNACLASTYTALDATRMPVLDPEHPLGIRSVSLWLINGAHRYACFVYAPTGHASHFEEFLGDRKLQSVMCDGSATNNFIERAGGKRGGCNAHARRKLVLALRMGDLRALPGIQIYAELFHVDAESLRAGETIAQRLDRRKSESALLVTKLREWIDAQLRVVEPKSLLGKALSYHHRQWSRLTAFLHNAHMELTNNEVERDLRRWVLDRKTWLFVGNDTSGKRAANALSLLATCRKFGIEPRKYLRDTLEKLLAGETDLTQLLPETYARKVAIEKCANMSMSEAA